MVDVEMIRTKYRCYVRSVSYKGFNKIIDNFHGVQIANGVADIGFNIELYDDIKKSLISLGLIVEEI